MRAFLCEKFSDSLSAESGIISSLSQIIMAVAVEIACGGVQYPFFSELGGYE